MVCSKMRLAVRNSLLVMFSLMSIITTGSGECSVDICNGEVPSCEEEGGYVFVNSLSKETQSFTLQSVIRVCDKRTTCEKDDLGQWRNAACWRANSKGIIKYECMSKSSYEQISKQPTTGPLVLNSSKNYKIVVNDNVCPQAIKMRTTVSTTLSLKRFTMQYGAANECIALTIMSSNAVDLPSREKAGISLPGKTDVTIRLNCNDCLLKNSAVWLIANVSPTTSSVDLAVKTPVPFIKGKPYTIESVPLVNLTKCDGNRGHDTTRRTPRPTVVQTASTASSTLQPKISPGDSGGGYMSTLRSTVQTVSTASSKLQPTTIPPGDSEDTLVIIIACSVSSFIILVIFVAVLVYFCQKSRKRRASTPNNDNDQTVNYSNVNPGDDPETRLTNGHDIQSSINYENCDIDPALSFVPNSDRAPSSVHYASCDLQTEDRLLNQGERMTTEPLSQNDTGNEDTVHNTYDSCGVDVKNFSSEPHDAKSSRPLQYESIDDVNTYDRLEKKTIPTSETEAKSEPYVLNETESNPTQCSDNGGTTHIIIEGDEYALVLKR